MNSMICAFFLCYLFVLAANGNYTKCLTSVSPIVEMDCSGMSLFDVPPSLESIQYHAGVKKLTLSHNNFNSSTSFRNWSALISLDLSYNKLDGIPSQMFGSLTHLKLLNLSFNNLSMISENAFDNLTILEVLDLSGNPLLGANIDMLNKSLAGILFRSLKKLTIRSSGLSSLPVAIFENAHELQYLDLSNNNIENIPILPPGLVYFKVNNNSIKTLDVLSFQKSKALKDLYVENNTLLNDIDVDAFENVYNLRNLSLKGSKSLERLPSHVFYFNKKLKYLSLAGSGFKTLPHSFKSAFLNIQELELQDNPWVCNISIKWFVLLDASNDEHLRCVIPGNYSFLEYYGPNIRNGVLRNLLVGLLLVVFVLFCIAIYLSYSTDKTRKGDNPYMPLGGKTPFSSGVYVTTVV